MGSDLEAVSLFSGIGGLDRAVEAHGVKVVAQVENDPFCQAVLACHWPDTPRYGSVEEVDWHAFRATHGPVDLVVAGFPCQPVSDAGQRKAQEDPRWLWPEVARCLRALRPGFVFLENVPGLLGRGMGDVLGDLAALGFDAEWCGLRASDVGAPHERERVFVLAYASCRGRRSPLGDLPARQPDPVGAGAAVADTARAGGGRSRVGTLPGGALLADPEGEQRGQGGTTEGQRPGRPASGGPALADADRTGLEVGRVEQARRQRAAAERSGTALADPDRQQSERARATGDLAGPSGAGAGQGSQRQRHGDAAWDGGEVVGDPEGERRRPGLRQGRARDAAGRVDLSVFANASQRRSESCMGGSPDGAPGGLDGHRFPAPPGPPHPWEPPRTIPGRTVPNRGKRLKALGNAVVPQQGALAFGLLWRRMLEAA